MNNKQLFDSLNNAADKYIIEAVEDYPELGVEKKRGFVGVLKYALPCAACAAVLFAGAAVIGNRAPLVPNSADVADTGIIIGTPLALPEIDTATFWEGELPVMPLKNCTNEYFEHTGTEFSPYIKDTFACAITGLNAKRGEAVYSLEDGEVIFVGVPGSPIANELTVIIKHSDDFYTTYSSLDEDCGIPVSVGDKVKAGQVIGYMGLSFRCHPEQPYDTILAYGAYNYDPLDYLYPRTERFEEWLNSGLVKPLDNIGDFEFDCRTHVISKNEKVTPAPYGANVYAVSSGTVVESREIGNGFGLVISIKVDDDIETTYYHLDAGMPHVEFGDKVSAGDVIGHVSDSSFSGVSGLGYVVEDNTYLYYSGFIYTIPD
ncbi:MAG: M23 family metallopeptidase [Ruminococcaceae bacterium]|nr:M23 family metallopeptidase [Oscillospiraceae bacterium]